MAAVISALSVAASQISFVSSSLGGDTGPYRPPQFDEPALYSITVPATASSEGQFYVFDCIHRAAHESYVTATRNPVQTGSAITSNIILEPITVTLEIGMSDALDSYSTGMWSGNDSKSVSAYQTMLSVQAARQLLTLSTRLQTYQNMILERVSAVEDTKTRFALRAVLVFREIFLATVTSQAVSARPQTTNSTPMGEQSASAPSNAIVQQHEVLPQGPGGSGGGGSESSIVMTGATTNEANAGAPPSVPFVSGGGTYTSGNNQNLGSN